MVSVRDCEQPYYFPKPVTPTKNINDILEGNVPEEYYLSERMIDYVYSEGGKNGGYKPARGVQDGNKPALALKCQDKGTILELQERLSEASGIE